MAKTGSEDGQNEKNHVTLGLSADSLEYFITKVK